MCLGKCESYVGNCETVLARKNFFEILCPGNRVKLVESTDVGIYLFGIMKWLHFFKGDTARESAFWIPKFCKEPMKLENKVIYISMKLYSVSNFGGCA